MSANDSIEKHVIRKIKLEKDLLYFTRYFFQELHNNKFIVNSHHEIIVEELYKVANYETELLIINIPPRFSKTELACVMFISWCIAKNPEAFFLLISANDSLRSMSSISIKDIIKSPAFQRYWPVEFKEDQDTKNLWKTKRGGGLYTATVTGQITGFGAGVMREIFEEERLFDGAIILDDINKITDTEDQNLRNEKVNDIIFNTIFSRKNSQDTPIINIQQRAGILDATASLIEYVEHKKHNKDKLVHLCLPVIQNGIPLWEFKQDLESIEDLKNNPKTSHVFETQYMQNPAPKEGFMFPSEELQYFTLKEIESFKPSGLASYTDTADKGTDNYAMPCAKVIDRKVYIYDVIFNHMPLKVIQERAAAKINDDNIDENLIETNKEGDIYVNWLAEKCPRATMRGVHNSANKYSRITFQAKYIIDNFLFRDDFEERSEYGLFMKEVTSYLKSGQKNKDDAPDSLAGLSKFIRTYIIR